MSIALGVAFSRKFAKGLRCAFLQSLSDWAQKMESTSDRNSGKPLHPIAFNSNRIWKQ